MNSSKKGIDRYSTFGLRDEWMPLIFTHEERWHERNNLGPVQVKAVRSWLANAGLIVKEKVTPLFGRIRDLYFLEPWQHGRSSGSPCTMDPPSLSSSVTMWASMITLYLLSHSLFSIQIENLPFFS